MNSPTKSFERRYAVCHIFNTYNLVVNVAGGTPLSPGAHTLLTDANTSLYSTSSLFPTTPKITGAGIAAGTKAYWR
jgi:hypothetical protein